MSSPGNKSDTDNADRGKEWFAGIMWEEMPEDAKEQIQNGGSDE